MSSVVKHPYSGQRYSVADYLSWPDDERWELIDGVAYDMSPAPVVKHQTIAGNLFIRLSEKLRGKPCRAFIAAVDVVLSEHDVVQPDVLVVCNPAKITEKNVQGAPDLVVEVLSPSTATKDLREKKSLYERSGVREYLVIDPLELYVQRFLADATGQFSAGQILGPRESLVLGILPDIALPLWEIFEMEAPEADPETPAQP